MKWIAFITAGMACHGLFGAEVPAPPGITPPAPEVVKVPRAPRAWLGLDLTKPDASITAQLPGLPPGVGFVVRSMEKDGPGAAAGLQDYDVLWKLNDQWLVNEGQLAALLRIFKPGDEIVLSGFRAGKPLEIKLKLGNAPVASRPFPSELLESAVLPGMKCDGPLREINLGNKTASYNNADGRAEVSKPGEAYVAKIFQPDGAVVFEGELRSDGDFEKIPAEWRHRIHALRRGLDLALNGHTFSARQPRPRVVPPPAKQ